MKNTKGSALILVILIISLISILTIISSERIVNTTKNSLIFSSQTQSYWYAMALESSASNYLSSKKQLDKIYDEKAQIEDLPKINVSFDNVNVQGTIRDLHSCFNLNILVKSKNSELIRNIETINILKSLLLNLNIDEFTVSEIIASLLDWIDSNDFTEDVNGAEDDFYTRLDNPYRTSNQLLFDLYELLSIKGFNKDLIQALQPYICIIPNTSDTRFNLNSISKKKPELLSAFFDNQISLTESSEILQDRPLDGFKDIEEFWSHPLLVNIQKNNNINSYLSFRSNFYELQTKVSNPINSYRMVSIFYIDDSNSVKVINRASGSF